MDPAMMAPPPGGAPMPGGDVEGAFSTIEAGLADAPPDQAEEARAHVNALREIFANIGGEGAPPPAEEPMPNPDEVPPPTEGG